MHCYWECRTLFIHNGAELSTFTCHSLNTGVQRLLRVVGWKQNSPHSKPEAELQSPLVIAKGWYDIKGKARKGELERDIAEEGVCDSLSWAVLFPNRLSCSRVSSTAEEAEETVKLKKTCGQGRCREIMQLQGCGSHSQRGPPTARWPCQI